MLEISAKNRVDPMNTLCKMVIDTNYDNLPENVVNNAKRAILDTLASTIGGSAREGIATVVDFVKQKGGKPESIIPFYGGKVPTSEAGFALGPMSRAMDFGDYHIEAGHCSEYILPTLLAALGLKKKVDGKEFITAFVVGSEVLIRIGKAYSGFSKRGSSGRGHGHTIFGCVASVSKLIGLNQDELENAEGIARDMTQPHDLTFYDAPANHMIRMHHGFICQDAINACLLAQKGITGTHEVLLPPRGYLGFAKWETDPDLLTNELGHVWEMLNLTMKFYPCWIGVQTTIYGILDQMRKYNIDIDNILSIDIYLYSAGGIGWVPKEQKWNPHTPFECQFSAPFLVATAMYTKSVPYSYTQQVMEHKGVRELMKKISVKEDQNLPYLEGLPFSGVRINTTLKNGNKQSDEYFISTKMKGTPGNPFSDKELVDKFRTCVPYSAYNLTDDIVNSLVAATLNLEEIDNVSNALLIPLTPE